MVYDTVPDSVRNEGSLKKRFNCCLIVDEFSRIVMPMIKFLLHSADHEWLKQMFVRIKMSTTISTEETNCVPQDLVFGSVLLLAYMSLRGLSLRFHLILLLTIHKYVPLLIF